LLKLTSLFILNCGAIIITIKNKITISKTKLLYITIICLLLTQSCKRGETDCGDLSDVITNYNIADSNITKIPYTGNETLVFISDAGDTATLLGEGKNRHYESVRSNIKGGDCPRIGIDNYESIEYVYNSDDSLIHQIYYRVFMRNGNLIISPPSYNSLRIAINGINFFDGDITDVNNEKYYIDSALIKGKYYKGLYIDDVKSILFSYKFGILKIKNVKNRNWVLSFN